MKPSNMVVTSVMSREVIKCLFMATAYANPTEVMSMSISLIPMNGAIMPPRP